MKVTIRFALILVFVVMSVNSSWAVQKAWLIGSTMAVKLNIETNTIEKECPISAEGRKNIYDPRTGNLFVLYEPSRFYLAFSVFELKSLEQKGVIDIKFDSSLDDEQHLILPPTGNLFYLRYIRKEGDTPRIAVYDATTLKPVNSYTTTPSTTNKLMLSANGDTLYSIVNNESELRVDLFDTSDFKIKSSINLKQYIGSNVLGFGIDDYKNGKLLIGESTEIDSYKFLYNIATADITKKILLKGNSYLLPQKNMIINLENQYVGKSREMVKSGDYIFTGKLNVYDAISGEKSGTVQLNVKPNSVGNIMASNPLEAKLYVITYNATGKPVPTLFIVDLKTYSVVKELPVPEVYMDMFFFDEPDSSGGSIVP